MIEKDRNVITSFVFSLDPSIFLRRSIKSFPIFLKISQTSPMRMMILTFNNPKKKIEFTNGNELEILLNCSSIVVSAKKMKPKKIINIHESSEINTVRGVRG